MRAGLLLVSALACFAADEVPGWVREAAATPNPPFPAKTPAVVLFQEETLTVDAEGHRVAQLRAVIRKLASGRVEAPAIRAYNIKSGKIRDIRAWAISASGKETRYGKDRVVEFAAGGNNLYDETRVKKIDPGEEWQAGGVFAYEIVEEERTLFTQYPYDFQNSLPVLRSRFTLTLPAGWEAKGQIFNHSEEGAYNQNGSTHSWELRNLSWIEPEEYRPDWHLLAPRLALTYFPSDGRAGLRPLKDWAAVSGWQTALSEGQAQLTPALRAKAAELTAKSAGPLESIRAIAAYVQQTIYISVQTNLTRGGGYTPHKADEVLAKNYGDCKDKANLMKALLAAAGIDSHLVAIYSGARDFVRPEWPSTMQFNHMIIAIRPPAGVQLPTVTEHPTLGRLLFFDPTDPFTPVGDLPEEEQGSYALVIAGEGGALVRVPRAPASANRITSETTAVMDADGGLRAQARRRYHGQSAAPLRAMLGRRDERAVRQTFERVLTRQMGGLTLASVRPSDQAAVNRLDLELEFTALQFGKLMQNRLLILAPGAMLAGGRYGLPVTASRKFPVQLEAVVREDKVSIQVPEGFQLDELPDPVHLKSSYGEYQARWTAANGKVEMVQALEIYDKMAPAAEYGQVKSFFEQVGGAGNAAVVLVRK